MNNPGLFEAEAVGGAGEIRAAVLEPPCDPADMVKGEGEIEDPGGGVVDKPVVGDDMFSNPAKGSEEAAGLAGCGVKPD